MSNPAPVEWCGTCTTHITRPLPDSAEVVLTYAEMLYQRLVERGFGGDERRLWEFDNGMRTVKQTFIEAHE
jgi:hypothetical protein